MHLLKYMYYKKYRYAREKTTLYAATPAQVVTNAGYLTALRQVEARSPD